MTNSINLPQLEVKMLREILYFLRPSEERQVWLVGGSIRDLLRGSQSLPDLDMATSFNPIPAAREFARDTGAGFVVLDAERHVVRLVSAVGNGHYTFDISEFRAPTIEEDLRARDFTINAIAGRLFTHSSKSDVNTGSVCNARKTSSVSIAPALPSSSQDKGSQQTSSLDSGVLELYDPLDGIKHLEQGLIIPCSDQLFIDDPLRLMRAFRFSALFNAEFSPELHAMIVAQAGLLKTVSGERIRDELFKVFGVSDSTHWVRIMDATGILAMVLPQLNACHGIEQNEWHHLDVFDHTIFALENLEKLLNSDQPYPWWPSFISYLNENASGTRTYAQVLKLGCLLHDLGKPSCRHVEHDSARVIFHGHEMEGARLAKDISERLRLSLNEMNFLQKVVKNHMRPGVMLQQGLNDKRLFRFYSECGRDGLGIALLSLADRYAAMGSLGDTELAEFTAGIFQIMHQFYEQMKKPKLAPFLNGNDLIKLFGLKPGPEFKRILETLEEEQYMGEISDRDQALARVKALVLLA